MYRSVSDWQSVALDAEGVALFVFVEIWARLAHPRLCRWFLKKRRMVGRFPLVAVPRTLNAKYTWRKIFDHDPRFPVVSDKLAVREFAAKICPDLPAPEVLWVGTDPADIPDSVLKGDVVVKTNHDSGANAFVRGGAYNRADIERVMRASLAKNMGRNSHEWGYFEIPRRVFVERMVSGGPAVEEAKFYTFGRRIELAFRTFDRQGNPLAQLREPDGQGCLRMSEHVPGAIEVRHDWPLPERWEEVVEFARQLGAPFDHMRVDLLTNGPEVYLGELTVYNQGGFHRRFGRDPSLPIARAWDIRRSWFLETPQPGWRGRYAETLRRFLDAEADDERIEGP